MATKETLPTLTAMLGGWLLIVAYRRFKARESPADPRTLPTVADEKGAPVGRRWSAVNPEVLHGLGLIIVSTAWFLIATFLIVAPLARQYFGAAGPIYLANRYSGGLAGLPSLLQDPARWGYVFGLLASVGFLPLVAPELLLLGLPVLAANLLSNFPGQYSGEQHYSAPLVAVLVIAAIYGTRRLVDHASLREACGQTLKVTTLIATLLWLAGWSLSYHTSHGWTPWSTRTEGYHLSPTAARLPDFAAQVPPAAVVSASAAIHPHLAHRRVIYIFPTLQEATQLLVDVTDIPGVHPNDAHTQIVEMLDTEWQVIQADQGLILAQKSASNSATPALPDSFYGFARSTAQPIYATPLTFGDDELQLLGYDVHDDPDDGVSFRLYWQASTKLPDDLRVWPLVYDDQGQLLSDPAQVPMIASVWYPPSAWQPGETIITETLPQLLPDTFHLGLAVGPEDSFSDPSRRWPMTEHKANQAVRLYAGKWAQLGSFNRQGPYLNWFPASSTFNPLTPTDVQFGPAIQLTGYWFESDYCLNSCSDIALPGPTAIHLAGFRPASWTTTGGGTP